MRSALFSKVIFVVAILFGVTAIGGCGSKVEGTYINGSMVTLDLKSGGKAMFTMMGETMPCTYIRPCLPGLSSPINRSCTVKCE